MKNKIYIKNLAEDIILKLEMIKEFNDGNNRIKDSVNFCSALAEIILKEINELEEK